MAHTIEHDQGYTYDEVIDDPLPPALSVPGQEGAGGYSPEDLGIAPPPTPTEPRPEQRASTPYGGPSGGTQFWESAKAFGGMAEFGADMVYNFAMAVPSFFSGLSGAMGEAFNSDPYDPKAMDRAAEAYLKYYTQTSEFTHLPAFSKYGKLYEKHLGDLLTKSQELIKEHIADPAFESGRGGKLDPLLGTIGLIAVDALALALGVRNVGKAPKTPPPEPRKPIQGPLEAQDLVDIGFERKTLEEGVPEAPRGVTARPPDAKMTFEIEVPEVPRGTMDLPKKADPMEPKPVGERTMADLEPSEPLEGIKPTEAPELSGELRSPAEYKEAPKPTREEFIKQKGEEEGLTVEEVVEAEKTEFGQEYDKLYPPKPISQQYTEPIGPSPDVTVYHGSGAPPPPKPITRWEPKALDTQNDSIFDATAKLGGLDRPEAENLLGIAPGEKIPATVFGRPLFRKKGKAVDEMGELLADEGYLERDPRTGMVDPHEFQEKFMAEAQGRKQYSKFREVDEEVINKEHEKFEREKREDERAERGDPGTTMHSGIPIEDVYAFYTKAGENIHDALGIPRESVEVGQRPPPTKTHPIQKALRGPSKLLKKVKGLAQAYTEAIKMQSTQYHYRGLFGRRFIQIRKTLKKDGFWKYRRNKNDLTEARMASDFRSKDLTPVEMRERGYSDNVVKAFTLIRGAYDHAYQLEAAKYKKAGKPVPEYLTGYVPHVFHDWFVIDRAKGEILDTATTMQQAISLANKLTRKNPEQKLLINFKPRHFKGEETQAAVLGDHKYVQLKKKLEKYFSITPEEATALLRADRKAGPKGSNFKHFFDREGHKGWSKQFDVIDKHYFNMLVRDLAMDEFSRNAIPAFEKKFGPIDNAHTGDAAYVKRYIYDNLGIPGAVERIFNELFLTAPGFKQLSAKFGGARPARELATTLSKGITLLKIGMYNATLGLVNGSQLTNVYAILGARDFAGGTKRAMIVRKDILASRWDLLKLYKRPNPDLWVLKKLGILEQTGFAGVQEMGSSAIMRHSTVIFREFETFNRMTAVLGGYHKFMRQNKNLPLKERKVEALKYADKVNNRANFNYEVEDGIEFMRQSGPPGQLAFKFWQFPFKQGDFMLSMKGAEHARFWVPWMILTGYSGAPFVRDISELGEYATGTNIELETKKFLMSWAQEPEDEAIKKERQVWADNIMYGILSQLGIDLSSRLGMGDLLDLQAGGVAYGTYVQPFIDLANGEKIKALRHLSSPLGNTAQALAGEVPRDWRGRKLAPLTKKEKFYVLMGSRPLTLSHERDKARISGYTRRQKREKIRDLIKNYWDAYDAEDFKKVQEHKEDLNWLGVEDEQITREFAMRDILTQSDRALYNTPSQDWPEALEYMGYGKERKKKSK